MSRNRRPGRVQKIASDDTPWTSTPDVNARIGWLLAMTRLHHRDADMADGATFTAALVAAGCTASRSLVSRWESGDIPASYEGMSAYERALGLPAGELSSLTGYLRAAIPGVTARVARPQLDPGSKDFSARLDELIETAEDGRARAGDWQDLGWHLAAVPLVHLRAPTWEAITHRVVTELPRSVNVAYRQYSTAAMNIASVPRAHDFLTDAVDRHVHTPGVQVLADPAGLLDQLPTRRAAEIVLELVEDAPSDAIRAIAVWTAAQKLTRGDFTAEERARLGMLVLQRWRANPLRASIELGELIASLPEGLRSTLTQAATRAGQPQLGYVVESGEDLDADLARGLSADLAEAARAAVPGDPVDGEDRMLVRLVREALFRRDSERRHLAALFLSASPFAEAVADGLFSLLSAPTTPEPVRVRAAILERYLGGEAHRLRMLGFVEDRSEEVAAPIVQGVGHLSFATLSDQAIRSSLNDEWSPRERAKMYALGMSASPVLESLAHARNAPAWQREAAQWWLSQGAAIRD
jgi:transcriptional regulator with XRE-family HTH domain